MQTAVGIDCGYDESAYVYSWSEEGWRRVWQNEQNTYTEETYKPQTITDVLISPYNKQNDYLLLTLGTESWCTSNWHHVYYRAFRLGPDPSAPPLIEGAEEAYLDSYGIHGAVTRDDVLVEFRSASIDGGVLTREAIRHYKIGPSGLKRIDPLALSPRDFVDEWLTHDWREAAFWSEDAKCGPMRDSHQKLAKLDGEFTYPTMHCPAMPDVWQVGIDYSEAPTPPGEEAVVAFFLVRWRPPYSFTMVDVIHHPNPDCTEEDPNADEDRTLFPGSLW